MNITIHRPTQIGGQITCIATNQSKIIIDLGHDLPNNNQCKDLYDDAEKIEQLTQGCSAILYTHYHGDHVGLFHLVPPNIPQYIGKVAKQVMCRKYQQLCYLPDAHDYEKMLAVARGMNVFVEREPLVFGDIVVTPYFVSHSAYDAYMFLVEAEGRRILHTGDFRGHGYLSKGLLPTIKKYIGQVDVLITEGTMLGRTNETILTEQDLSAQATSLMQQHKYVFVLCSSTDMERLASFKNANNKMRPHRPLLADEYQKDVLKIFSDTAGEKTACFDFGKVYVYSQNNQKLTNWMIDSGFTMFVRASSKYHQLLDSLLEQLPPQETPLFIYSMWEGYVTRPENIKKEYLDLENRFKKSVHLHTSGHATVAILKQVCEGLNPSMAIIPVHREADTDFASLVGLTDKQSEKVLTHSNVINDINIQFL